MNAPAPIDPTKNPHLQSIFEPTQSEIDVANLTIVGELPPEINGDYVRNGPNPRFTPIGSYIYPLDGDGMLHRIRFRDGKASYSNRFVRTPGLVAEESVGRALWPGLADRDYTPGADLVGPSLAHTVKDLPGINVVRHAGSLLALGESITPYRISPALETLGCETFGGLVPVGTTAHPKVDPNTGEMVVFCYNLEAPYLTWSVIGRDGIATRTPTPVDTIDRPVMIHDMALTLNYVVIVVAPLFFDLGNALKSGSPMSWEPDSGTRVALIPRDGSPVRWVDSDTFWLWHTANAHEDNGVVVLDYVHWDAPNGFAPGVTPTASLARLRIDVAAGTLGKETLVDRAMEFPRVDDRVISGQHRVVGTAVKSGRRDLISGDSDMLGWYDTQTDSFATWDAGNLAVGEQCFIPRPGDTDSRHGWWTVVATDRTDLSSRLLIIPAEDPAHGPVATVNLPQRVPAGLHGAWLPTEE